MSREKWLSFLVGALLVGSIVYFSFFPAGRAEFAAGTAVVSKTFGEMVKGNSGVHPALEIPLNQDSSSSLNTSVSENSRTSESLPPSPITKNRIPVSDPSVNASGESSSSAPVAVHERPQKDCPFSAAGVETHGVHINEVAWMGSVKSANDEWFEFHNSSSSSVSLAGAKLLSQDGSINVMFGEGSVIGANGFYLLERTDDTSVPGVTADKIYSGSMPNAGAWLKLIAADCTILDEINAMAGWPGGDNGAKLTLERDAQGFGWHTGTVTNGTPRAENSVPVPVVTIAATVPPSTVIPPPVQAPTSTPPVIPPPSIPEPNPLPPEVPPSSGNSLSHIVIRALQITGGPGKTTNDFVELYNPLGADFNLKGFRLVKRTKTGTTDTSLKSWTTDVLIPAGGSYLWANSAYTNIGRTVNATTTGSIADDNGIALRQGTEDTGTVIDAVAWGGAANAFVEGSVFVTNPAANQVLTRKDAMGMPQDTDNNANDFELH